MYRGMLTRFFEFGMLSQIPQVGEKSYTTPCPLARIEFKNPKGKGLGSGRARTSPGPGRATAKFKRGYSQKGVQ